MKALRNVLVVLGIVAVFCFAQTYLRGDREPLPPADFEDAIDGALSTALRSVVDNDFVIVSFDTDANVSFAEYQMIQMLCAGRDFTDKGIQFSAFMPDGAERINGLTVYFEADTVQDFPCDAEGQIALEPVADSYDLSPRFR